MTGPPQAHTEIPDIGFYPSMSGIFSWHLGSECGVPLPDQLVVAYLVTAGVASAARTRVVQRLLGVVV